MRDWAGRSGKWSTLDARQEPRCLPYRGGPMRRHASGDCATRDAFRADATRSGSSRRPAALEVGIGGVVVTVKLPYPGIACPARTVGLGRECEEAGTSQPARAMPFVGDCALEHVRPNASHFAPISHKGVDFRFWIDYLVTRGRPQRPGRRKPMGTDQPDF